MDYKKIIKSRSMRSKILRMLRFIPDRPMLELQYYIKMGRRLNLKNPRRYTEKLQWYKINYRNPLMHQCVDKYLVRDYVKDKGLEDILVKLYGRYDSIHDVDWDALPDSFVIKTTHGGGGLSVVVCPSKQEMDIEAVKEKLLFENKPIPEKRGGREWAYYGLIPGIVAEELLVNTENPEAGVNDYKIFCYSGKAKYIVVDADRYIGHKRNFYDTEWNNIHVGSDCPALDRDMPKPENFDEMIRIAEKLSEDFPYVRVDLYNIEGKIYFGELTFYPWSGYVQYTPDDWDYKFGEDFVLRKF